MMAKITKGSDFKGVVDYILDKNKNAQVIAFDGLFMENKDTIAMSFNVQWQMNSKVSKPVGHIALSFSKEDEPRLTNRVMAGIALEYMERMGIRDTQFFIARHFDKEHPHVHIAFNRIDNNGNTLSDRNERLRSSRICKELTMKYGLHMANGKENVKRERLKEPDKTKYELYDILKTEVGRCGNWNVLAANLKRQGVEVYFKRKGQTDEIKGVVFTKNGYRFNGSKVDRHFSYSKIDAALDQNRRTERIEMPLPSRHEELSTFQPESRGNDYLYSGSIGLFMPDNTDRQAEENYFEEQLKRRNKKKKQRKIRF